LIGLKTISFPSISTGAYGYHVEKVSWIALMAVVDFLRKNDGLAEVRFVLHNQKDLLVYEEALNF
jgi:O-acetyl-ADP-ribose deacetylase (regulator of RNase III)